MEFTETNRYDFGTEEGARIAARVLSVGCDLKPEENISTFSVDGSQLVFKCKAINEKVLHKAINAQIPSIELVRRTIDAFHK